MVVALRQTLGSIKSFPHPVLVLVLLLVLWRRRFSPFDTSLTPLMPIEALTVGGVVQHGVDRTMEHLDQQQRLPNSLL